MNSCAFSEEKPDKLGGGGGGGEGGGGESKIVSEPFYSTKRSGLDIHHEY